MMNIDRRRFISSMIGGSLFATQFGLRSLGEQIDEFCDAEGFTGSLLRSFELPLPLFSDTSAWRQRADSTDTKANNDGIVATVYGMLTDAKANFCWINLRDFTIPIFAAHLTERFDLSIHAYHAEVWKPTTLPSLKKFGRYVVSDIPKPAGWVRPAGPATDWDNNIDGRNADGHLVLYDSQSKKEYDLWQATTCRDYDGISKGGGLINNVILETGAVEAFNVKGPGAQKLRADCKPLGSARATGVPLLAGLLVPEDLKNGINSQIAHALVFALPRLRHLCPADAETPPDFVYPTSKAETSFYFAHPFTLGAGERIRLRKSDPNLPLLDTDGNPIDEELLAPITQKFIQALREYGAYLVDGAGSFAFYAEDIHTANLPPDHVNDLIGEPAETPLPAAQSNWQVVIERLQAEIRHLPFAVVKGSELHANFEAIENADVPTGFDADHCSIKQINQCDE